MTSVKFYDLVEKCTDRHGLNRLYVAVSEWHNRVECTCGTGRVPLEALRDALSVAEGTLDVLRKHVADAHMMYDAQTPDADGIRACHAQIARWVQNRFRPFAAQLDASAEEFESAHTEAGVKSTYIAHWVDKVVPTPSDYDDEAYERLPRDWWIDRIAEVSEHGITLVRVAGSTKLKPWNPTKHLVPFSEAVTATDPDLGRLSFEATSDDEAVAHLLASVRDLPPAIA
ncbi:MAG: hypothetical protein KY476_00595 [Planctomycetes bacterium]|nr:hypothetical protein [Planctomycetota bacterium]